MKINGHFNAYLLLKHEGTLLRSTDTTSIFIYMIVSVIKKARKNLNALGDEISIR